MTGANVKKGVSFSTVAQTDVEKHDVNGYGYLTTNFGKIPRVPEDDTYILSDKQLYGDQRTTWLENDLYSSDYQHEY